jgi:hypothetical protein
MVFDAGRTGNIEVVVGLASDFNLGAIIIGDYRVCRNAVFQLIPFFDGQLVHREILFLFFVDFRSGKVRNWWIARWNVSTAFRMSLPLYHLFFEIFTQKSNDREDAYGTADLIDEIVAGVDISAS